MNNKNTLIQISILLILSAFACQKSPIEKTKHDYCDNLVYFDSFQELEDELREVLTYNIDKKISWMEEKGFTSPTITGQKILQETNLDLFNSKNEIIEFVQENNKYLALTKDDNGEYEVDTKYPSSPYKYFANEYGIFQIGNFYSRVYDEGIITVREESLPQLIESDYQLALSLNIVNHSVANKSGNTCPKTIVRTDNGNERIRLQLSYIGRSTDNQEIVWQAGYYYEIRGYKKTLGIWWRKKRELTANIDMQYFVGDKLFNVSKQLPVTNSYVFEYSGYFDKGYFTHIDDLGFQYYDCWAKQQYTSRAVAYCSN